MAYINKFVKKKMQRKQKEAIHPALVCKGWIHPAPQRGAGFITTAKAGCFLA